MFVSSMCWVRGCVSVRALDTCICVEKVKDWVFYLQLFLQTGHNKLQSLIEITGLQAPPQVVALQNLDGTVEQAEEALSISELRKLEHGSLLKCRDGVYHSVILHPGTTGRHGHIIYLYF